jgi:CheY-like chemotaxis protein
MTLTVLCVDDSNDDTILLQHACRRAAVGFRLQTLDDGEKAIQYLSGQKTFSDRTQFPVPHLVLLDLKMPCKTGFEVLDWMRTNSACANVPVAVFTSSQHDADIRPRSVP